MSKRKYAGIIVLNAKGKEDSVEDMISTVGKEIEAEGATLEQIDQLGRKEFAYNARHLEAGFYVNYLFEAEPAAIATLQTRLKLNNDVHLQHYELRK